MDKDWTSILKRLLSEESAYTSLYNHHPNVIFVLDRQGRCVGTNHTFYLESSADASVQDIGLTALKRIYLVDIADFEAALQGSSSSFELQDVNDPKADAVRGTLFL